MTREQSLSSYRFCCDFRYLNTQIQDFNYTIPDLQELTESFSERVPEYITSLDLSSGFFQMGLSSESTKYTAFSTCYGTWKLLRLPQGLRTAPNGFQLLMDKILHGLTFINVLCYICIFSESFDQHLCDLNEVLTRLGQAGLKLRPKPKCKFAQTSCIFLGHEISKNGIRPPSDRIDILNNYPTPQNRKELQRALGMFNWFRKFIPNYSATSSVLYYLLKKNVSYCWTDDCEDSFQKLKDDLAQSEALAFPRYDIEFRLAVDTSSKGIGYMLYQLYEDGSPRVVRFGSKGLSKWQQSYGPTKLELLGVVTSVLDCASYLRGRHFTVECDHQALRPLFQKQLKGAIYERWLAILQQFDVDIVYKPAAQMTVPDALSRLEQFPDILTSSPEEEDPHFPYVPEKMTRIKLIPPEGHTVQQLNAADVILSNPEDDLYDADTEDNIDCADDFQRTKLIRVRRSATRKRVLPVLSDTNYMPKIQDSTVDCDSTVNSSEPVDMLIMDDHNTDSVSQPVSQTDHAICESDVPPNMAKISSSDSQSDVTEALKQAMSQFDMSPESIRQCQELDENLNPLVQYLSHGILPESQKRAREILIQQSDYALIDGVLFHTRVAKTKRTKSQSPYQLVVPQSLITVILQLFHDSPLGAHGGIQDTIDRVKEHYYFPRLATIVSNYVKSCHDCQARKVTKVQVKNAIVAYPTPMAPFSVWEIDLFGPLPRTAQGNAYVFTALDLFAKFLYAVPIAAKDALTVSESLWRLFTTFGVCDTLITDQGSEFTAIVTQELCKILQIPQQFTPSFVHHCLGACERAHSTLANLLTPYMNTDANNWDFYLPTVVFAFNLSVNSSMGYSPFEVLYAQRPKFPLVNHTHSFQSLPKDVETFMPKKLALLAQIRKDVSDQLDKSKKTMPKNTNYIF